MGLFSSKYVTTVGTTVSRVLADNSILPSNKVGLMASLFGEDSSQLVENVLENLLGGMGIRAERMYGYAKNYYTYGLPTARVTTSTDGKLVVMGVLKTLTSPTITEVYYNLGPLNILHVGWVNLVDSHGYDSATNQLSLLSSQEGFPVYLKDMVIVVQDATLLEQANGSLDQWGTAAKAGYTPERPITNVATRDQVLPTPFRVDPLAITDSVLVSYTWVNTTTKVTHEDSFSIPITGYDTLQDFFHIKYLDGAQEKYWLYQINEGTHPEIDTLFDAIPDIPGEFFPNIYFRHGSVAMSSDLTAPGYKTSQRMMKTLGMNYLDVINAIHENPDIADVDQALMTFAVPANTTNPVEQQYLFDFFSKLSLAVGGVDVGLGWDVGSVVANTESAHNSLAKYTRSVFNIKAILTKSSHQRVRVEIYDKRLGTALSAQGIFKRKKAGVIAAIGVYTSSFTTEQITYHYTKREADPTTGEMSDVPYTKDLPVDSHIYRHQISTAVYEEVQVYDLKMTYYMWGGYSTIGDNLDAILLVPLDHSITRHYTIMDRESLYSRSMHYVFNSRIVTKVKWYQQAWFGDLIMIVGIVLTVMSLGSDGGFFAKLGAVIAFALTVMDVIMYLLMVLVKYLLVVYAFKLFVKLVGPQFAMMVALIAALYGGYSAIKAGSVQGAPWAQELLSLSSNLASNVSESVQDSLNGLKQESDGLNLLMKEKTDLLGKANKLLEGTPLLSPYVIFGESPDDFYNRTVHSGNIGIVGIDSVASYVDIALTLPKLNDTLESYNYGT